MTLLFGIACAAILCLTAGDRLAFRWAVLLSAMYGAQFLAPLINPAMNGVWAQPIIEGIGMGTMIILARQYTPFAGPVFFLSLMAQAANLSYFVAYALYIDVGALWWWTLQVLYGAQLWIVGSAGAPKTWRTAKALSIAVFRRLHREALA